MACEDGPCKLFKALLVRADINERELEIFRNSVEDFLEKDHYNDQIETQRAKPVVTRPSMFAPHITTTWTGLVASCRPPTDRVVESRSRR